MQVRALGSIALRWRIRDPVARSSPGILQASLTLTARDAGAGVWSADPWSAGRTVRLGVRHREGEPSCRSLSTTGGNHVCPATAESNTCASNTG